MQTILGKCYLAICVTLKCHIPGKPRQHIRTMPVLMVPRQDILSECFLPWKTQLQLVACVLPQRSDDLL